MKIWCFFLPKPPTTLTNYRMIEIKQKIFTKFADRLKF
jgi:hypothetical protein